MTVRKVFILFVLVSIISGGCNLINPEENHIPEIPGKIVFSMLPSSESGHHEVFVMNTDGTGLKRLTRTEAGSSLPSWSSDGTQIIFTTSKYLNLGFGALAIMDADGKNLRPIKEVENLEGFYYPGSFARFNHDNSKILFQNCIDCKFGNYNSELFIYDFEQDSIFRIAISPGLDEQAYWSPDGNDIVFVSEREQDRIDSGFDRNLYNYSFANNKVTRLTSFLDHYPSFPLWTQKDKLVYSSANGGGRFANKLFELDLKDTVVTQFESDLNITSTPQFSKDGTTYFIYGRQTRDAPLELHFHSLPDSGCVSYMFNTEGLLNNPSGFVWSGIM